MIKIEDDCKDIFLPQDLFKMDLFVAFKGGSWHKTIQIQYILFLSDSVGNFKYAYYSYSLMKI